MVTAAGQAGAVTLAADLPDSVLSTVSNSLSILVEICDSNKIRFIKELKHFINR